MKKQRKMRTDQDRLIPCKRVIGEEVTALVLHSMGLHIQEQSSSQPRMDTCTSYKEGEEEKLLVVYTKRKVQS